MLKDPSDRLRRAIKENNLFLVKRIIEQRDDVKSSRNRHPTRIDMRNPDPGPGRYTSLAWAAAFGHEEIFDYLLNAGHDDEELSRDAENNTILILLAGIPNSVGGYGKARGNKATDHDMQDFALRMARNYYERFPFLIDWSNIQGKTSLHVAATKGNEKFVRMFLDLGADFDLPDLQGNTPLHYASAWNHVSIIQLLIERGCQFAARNNEGFTASDYAFSMSTMATLQETARLQFENNKKARRNIFAQAAARGNERRAEHNSSSQETPDNMTPQRLRSGSAGNYRSTGHLDSGDVDPANQVVSFPNPSMRQAHQFSASTSSPGPNSNRPNNSIPPSSSSQVPQQSLASSSLPSAFLTGPTGSTQPATNTTFSALSPVASRMRDRDADAMAEYLKRNRSGSDGSKQKDPAVSTQQTTVSTVSVVLANPVQKPATASVLPGNAPRTSSGDATNGSSTSTVVPAHSTTATLPSSNDEQEARDSDNQFASPPPRFRRLRPSNSSASLRPAGIIGMPSAPVSGHNHSNSATIVTTGGNGIPTTLDLINEALVGLSENDLRDSSAGVSTGGTRPLEIRPKKSMTADSSVVAQGNGKGGVAEGFISVAPADRV
ncbi:hypothetical protein FRC03_011538 [Tulasnella sp. 419]|nr:hypothetical protein FRC02_005044 [Tulasnella sp. 418]KAG8954307.1 hypothetical protein FRC03_011538 [Tulasnella sp. 419]